MQENGSPLFCGKSICRSIAVSLFFKFMAVTVHIPILFRGTLGQFTPEYIENTFWVNQRTFRSLEIHSKRRYKSNFVRSSWENLSFFFSKLQGLQHYFPKNCRCNLMSYEIEDFFLFLSPLHFLSSQEVGDSFFIQRLHVWLISGRVINS